MALIQYFLDLIWFYIHTYIHISCLEANCLWFWNGTEIGMEEHEKTVRDANNLFSISNETPSRQFNLNRETLAKQSVQHSITYHFHRKVGQTCLKAFLGLPFLLFAFLLPASTWRNHSETILIIVRMFYSCDKRIPANAEHSLYSVSETPKQIH